METFMILLPSMKDVQKFVTNISKINSDCDLICKRYIVDAKSLLGILSLDMNSPLELRIYSYDEDMKELIQEFLVE